MAAWVADSRMEQIKNAGCSQAASITGMSTDTSTGTTVSLTGNSAGTTLTGLRKVTIPGCTTSNDVVVSITWTEPGNAANSSKVNLESYVGP